MHLKLALGGNVIASIPLNSAMAGSLEYIYDHRCLLAEACLSVIAMQRETPEFFIDVPSRMNQAGKE